LDTGGPLTSEQLAALGCQMDLAVQEVDRSLPTGMLADVTFAHLSVRLHSTKSLWSYMQALGECLGLTAPTRGMEGACLFVVSSHALSVLSESLRQELTDENGLTPWGLKRLSGLAQSISGRFVDVLGKAAGLSLGLAGEFGVQDPEQILRPLAALDSSMIRGFIVDSVVSVKMQSVSLDREGQIVSIFVPRGGDLSKVVEGMLSSAKRSDLGTEYTVLLVDDAPFMRNMIKKYLKDSRYVVIGECSTGAEAIESYKELKPDLVIMDIMMPDMGGVAAVRGIREVHDKAKVLMCSALSSRNMVQDALSFGAKGYVVKPFKGPNLLAAIEEVLQKD